MDRISTATKAVDLFGAGKHGWKDGNLGLGIPPTDLNAEWFNGVQEELVGMPEAVGVALGTGAGNHNKVLSALRRMFGGNYRVLTNGATVLTADDAGDVYIDASAGAVTVTLPATDAAGGRPIPLRFMRTDTSGNSVTINRAGANTIFNFTSGGTSITMRVGQELTMRSNGGNGAAGVWRVLNGRFARSIGSPGWRITPDDMIEQFGSVNSVGSGGIVTITFPLAFPNAVYAASALPSNAAATAVSAWREDLTLTQFKVRSDAGVGTGIYWRAIGS